MVKLVGHRGAAGEAPENTIDGIAHATAIGVRHVEIDLRLSADQQLVVIHDATLQRTHGINSGVAELTVEQLKTYPALKSTSHPSRRDEYTALSHVPSLNEFLQHAELIKHFQLELKSDETTEVDKLIDAIDYFSAKRTDLDRFVFTSFDRDLLAALHHQCPKLSLGLIAKDDTDKVIAELDVLPYQYLCLHYLMIDRFAASQRSAIAQHNLHLSTWTVNKQLDFERMVSLGVDSIITDYPSRFIDAATY